MRFDGFVGHAAPKARVSAFVDTGRFPHALLIEGARGSGRRTLARLIAQAAVCTGEGERPCGVCVACRKALAGSHPDITAYGGDGSARSFHLETLLKIREDAYVLPNEAAKRVFLLADAQAMTERAQNALLKVLEEPPAHVLFLLTCESRAQLLSTIQSRTVALSLGPVTAEEALPFLRQKLPDRGVEELSRALSVFGGSIGQTLEGLQDGEYQQVLTQLSATLAGLTAPHELPLLKTTASLSRDKALLDGLLSALILVFRDALAARNGVESRLSPLPEEAAALAGQLTAPQLMRLIEVTEELQTARLRNMNMSLLLTRMCALLRGAAGR